MLPQEAVLRIFEALPHESAVVCERVCHEWRSVARDLPEWSDWLDRMGRVTEVPLSIPGTVATTFGAPPVTVTAAQTAVAAAAAARAHALGKHEIFVGVNGAFQSPIDQISLSTDRSHPYMQACMHACTCMHACSHMPACIHTYIDGYNRYFST